MNEHPILFTRPMSGPYRDPTVNELRAKYEKELAESRAREQRLREKCDYLAERALLAGRIPFRERDCGASSNYIVAIACWMAITKALPLDQDDIDACERMWAKLPESMKTEEAVAAMNEARAALKEQP